MIKYYYFGYTSPEDHETMGATSFEFGGSYWQFKVEVMPEDGFIRIYDAVGRMIPVDKDQFIDLSATLGAVIAIQEDFDEAKQAMSDIMDGAVDAGIRVVNGSTFYLSE